MATKTCPYCGNEHLDIALGSHIDQCKKLNPEPKYSLKSLEKRITKLEQILKKNR